MQVTTKVGQTRYKDWEVKVHTRKSVYPGSGKFFTCLSLNGKPTVAGIQLVSRYTWSEEEAAKAHLEIASKAKTLFDLVK